MEFSNDASWLLDLGDGMLARATERPDSPLLARFFAGYDRAFVLPVLSGWGAFLLQFLTSCCWS